MYCLPKKPEKNKTKQYSMLSFLIKMLNYLLAFLNMKLVLVAES